MDWKTQERTKVFMWILARDRVMTNWSRWRRSISQNPDCDHCNAEKEDVAHAIRDYKESKRFACFYFSASTHRLLLLGTQTVAAVELVLQNGRML